MAKYRIETPDGQTYEIDGPDGASDDEIVAITRQHVNKVAPGKFDSAGVNVNQPKADTSLQAVAQQGASFGLSDEIAGGAGALYNAMKAPFSASTDFDPAGAYREWRDRDRATVEATRKESPWLSLGVEGVNSLVGPAGITRGATSLWNAVKTGAKGGAALGSLAGFGYGEGAGGSLAGAGLGAGLGSALGAAIPLGYRMLERPIQAGIDFMRPRNGVGRELVSRAMRDDAVTPSMAGQRLSQANANGTPLGLMDLGDNLRGLTGAVGRAPGTSRTLVRDAVIPRQVEQGERIRESITRDLGPINNTFEQGDELIQQARTAAAPLYDAAYAAPGASSVKMDDLAMRPSFRTALRKAGDLVAEAGDDPMALGFQFDKAGDTLLTDVPSFKTIDYIKRGLDDVIEGYRDKTSGKLVLDGQGRATNETLRTLLSRVDAINPDYAAARAAYSGPAQLRSALERGRKATNMSAEEIQRNTRGMGPGQIDQFLDGHRSALAEGLERRVDGADKAHAMLGTPRKRAALGQLYEGRGDMGRFNQTLTDELAAAETYRTVNTGSPTSQRILDDQMTSDPSLLEDVAARAVRGGQNGMTGLVAEGISAMRDVNRFGAGATGQRAREDAAALLSNTDPELLMEAMRAGMRDTAARRLRDRQTRRGLAGAGTLGGRTAGAIGGYSLGLEQP